MTVGEKITRASGSNLALAFFSLTSEKRRDMNNFYAFCRLVDDLADEPGPLSERAEKLAVWRRAVRVPTPGEHPLADDLRETLDRYAVDRSLLDDIISGMEMDLLGTRYETLADLQLYCYRVAGAVGLVSIEIFEYTNPSARDHARSLGEALQLTNILRDVAQDYRENQRIYLPGDAMRAHGYSQDDLKAGHHTKEFVALMKSLALVAEKNYRDSEAFIAPEDRASLRPARIMSEIYHRVLSKMQRDEFRVFSRRYRLNKIEKIAILLRHSLSFS